MESHRTYGAARVGAARSATRFGALLRRYRLEAGLTQRELAQRAGLGMRGINALETGERQTPRQRTIALVADALALAPADRAALVLAARPRPQVSARALQVLPFPTSRLDNLPAQSTPLLGRERELAELTTLLRGRQARLITLTGPGGVGKTSLALQAARELRDGKPDDANLFPGGVWYVRLAPLTDPALIIPTIAETLGLSETGASPLADALRVYVRELSLLLLLDNFEQLTEAAPQVAELLEWSAGLSLLVTSRAALRLRAEHRYPVALLAVPPMAPTCPQTIAQLDEYAATALFVQRARAAQPSFPVTDATAPQITAICARLEGLPLAIELAAAHATLLPPAALLARLDRQLPTLTGGAVDLPERQQTMRATIAWSYGLLEDEPQRLFRRLAVFVDSAALAAVEAVCLEPAGAPPLRLGGLEGLSGLVDRSLVALREPEGEPRVRMLHVMREFALEQLHASDEAPALRRAHAQYFLDLAERIEPELRGSLVPHWLRTVERELGNMRAALDWALASGEVEVGLRLATALWRFWFQGGHLSEGQRWIEALLALADATEASLPAWLRARALADLGMLLATQRRFGPAAAALEAGVALGRAANDWLALSIGLQFSGAILRITGHTEQAAACFEEVVAIGRARGDALSIYTPLASLAQIALDHGDLATASARFSEAIAVSRAAGHLDHVGAALQRLGELALMQNDARRAAALLREAIQAILSAGILWALANALELLAAAYARMGQEERAARLFGAVTTSRTIIKAPYTPAEQPGIEALVAPARAAMSAGAWTAAFAAGQSLSLEEACAEALVAPAPEAAASSREQAHGVSLGAERLTRRELEVLRLLAQGWTDARIADELVLSTRTVNHHVTAIYGKLAVSSRAAATRAALERGLL
jgi:predicted ATPase/DNA-binding CsgD family transcriptional regulator/DNA-binding XRE family transcriptional regulator